ncbi:MAG: hypothetical protein KZQ83_06255 [gamma proteobacterium symbiont of Taylorina sp.]|nr:hypothetical protein [gamma proteobacterium symbiont of Taylorina sp.]
MIRKYMVKPKNIVLIFILLFTHLLLTNHAYAEIDFADNGEENDDQPYVIKALIASGEISALENILNKLSEHNINRLLEVELKQEAAHVSKHPFIYEIEYINNEGMVLEIEVDALTAQVLSKEYEH